MAMLDAKTREAVRVAARKGRAMEWAMLVGMPLLLGGLLLGKVLDHGQPPSPARGIPALGWALFGLGLGLPLLAWGVREKLKASFTAQPLPQTFAGAQVFTAAMTEAMAIFGFAIHLVAGVPAALLTWTLLALCPLVGWALAPRVEAWIDAAEGR